MSKSIKGLDQLQNKLKRLGDMSDAEPILRAAGKDLEAWIKEYPDINNRAVAEAQGKRSWYERKQGSAYLRKDGRITIRPTSQRLGSQWSVKTQSRPGEVVAIVGNKANRYNIYVHSAEKQARVMAARGWRTDRDAIIEKRPVIIRQVRNYIRRILNG